MSDLKINPEYASLVSPLSDADYESLKQSISKHGLYSPIVINAQDEILDGHNRYRACQELGIEPTTEVKFFDDAEEEKVFVIEANLKRRQLSDIERIDLVRKLEPLEAELARKRQLAHLKSGGAPISPSGSKEHDGDAGRVRDIMAEKAGVSPSTYYKGKMVLEQAPDEVREKVRSGEMTIGEGYEKVRPSKKSREPRDFIILPSSCFDELVDAIKQAREKGDSKIKLMHNGHEVVSTTLVVFS